MKSKLLMLLSALVLLISTAKADVPFRQHRADHFFSLDVHPENIVFIGNSITNMHEWREAFDNPLILNRGISGAISDEVVTNLESFISGQPKKIFLMIGTNDLGTNGMNYAEYPFRNFQKIVSRIQKECPSTELYVQSILPSRLRNNQTIAKTNQLMKDYCSNHHITYIDLWSLFIDPNTKTINSRYTYDGLHPTAMGYRLWCKSIEKYVGSKCVYPKIDSNESNQVGGSNGMRITSFGNLPIKSNDILMLGDEVQHGGEWAELLRSANIKSRGIGWGYPGTGLNEMNRCIDLVLKGNKSNQAPKKIFIYTATKDANSNKSLESIVEEYKQLIQRIKQLVPTTEIYIESLLPCNDPSRNTSRYVPLNNLLQDMSHSEGVHFIDIYTPFIKKNVADTKYFKGVYLYSLGYIKLANLLAPFMGKDIHPISEKEGATKHAINVKRNTLGTLIYEASQLKSGYELGKYPPNKIAKLQKELNEAIATMQTKEATAEQLNKEINNINTCLNSIKPYIGKPTISIPGEEEHWYTFCATKRGNKYVAGNGINKDICGQISGKYKNAMWKITPRTDAKFNIVNRNDNSFLDPNVDFNKNFKTTLNEPSIGWEISYAEPMGLYIIRSNKSELNQTSWNNSAIVNWSKKKDHLDRDDAGCVFLIEKAEEPTEEEEDKNFKCIQTLEEITPGWYKIRVTKGSDQTMQGFVENNTNNILNAENEYRQVIPWGNHDVFHYALKINKYSEEHPATAYIYINTKGEKYQIIGLNGHLVEENCTASRNLNTFPLTFSSIGKGMFHINHWSYYSPKDGKEKPYIGKSSSSHHAFSFAKLTHSELSAADIYQVIITNSIPGKEISDDTSVSFENKANLGIKRVYNNGYFFISKDTPLTPEMFTVNNTGNKKTNITISKGKIQVELLSEKDQLSELLKQAKSFLNLGLSGLPGFPTYKACQQLQKSIAEAEQNKEDIAITQLQQALHSYLSTTDINKPLPGHSYILINKQRNGKKMLLNNVQNNLVLNNYQEGKYPLSSIFVCRGNSDGSFTFASHNGNYLIWKGTDNRPQQDNGANNNSGNLKEYDAYYCNFKFESLQPGSFVKNTTPEDLFGLITLTSNRIKTNGRKGCFIIDKDGLFNQADLPFYTEKFSSAFYMIEVDNYNKTSLKSSPNGAIGSIFLPYPSEIPEEVSAYCAELKKENDAIPYLLLHKIEGKILPSSTPAILISEKENDFFFLPATQNTELVNIKNDLKGSVNNEPISGFAYTLNNTTYTMMHDEIKTTPLGRAFFVYDEFIKNGLKLSHKVIDAIETINNANNADTVFDLHGRNITKNQKGILILNGKKIIQ